MGSLILPTSGPVYFDASAIIYAVETHSTYWPLLQPLWQQVDGGQLQGMSSALALLECLVAPLRQRDHVLIAAYDQVLAQSRFQLLPIDRPSLRRSAELRAGIVGLRTPDAIHAATALLANCVLFVTNDPGFTRIPGLPVVVLDSLLTP